jgi:hypothetical protein
MNSAFPTSVRISQTELHSSDKRSPQSAIRSQELNDSLPVNDISDQIREAVLHLQRDLDRVTARVRSLEVSALSGSLSNSLVSDHKLINCTVPTKISGFNMYVHILKTVVFKGQQV